MKYIKYYEDIKVDFDDWDEEEDDQSTYEIGDRVRHGDKKGTIIGIEDGEWICIETDNHFGGHDGNGVKDRYGNIVKGKPGHCIWCQVKHLDEINENIKVDFDDWDDDEEELFELKGNIIDINSNFYIKQEKDMVYYNYPVKLYNSHINVKDISNVTHVTIYDRDNTLYPNIEQKKGSTPGWKSVPINEL